VATELVCQDCARTFVWEDHEQERYARDGFDPPRRCRACRAARRARRGGKAGGGKAEGAPKPAAPAPGFEAQCGACGVLTRVPFEPKGDRPVYCATCFQYR
jgi:CxxC-x17-CxxC domain-containing protein